MMTASLALGFKTDIGRKRTSNQDSYAVLRRSELDNRLDGLIVVADGMGGVGGGEIASGIVAQTIPAAIIDILSQRSDRGEPIDPGELLVQVMRKANENVRARQETQPGLSGMGTTCVSGILLDGVMTIGNVGDSRVYLMRRGRLQQITEDHSEVWAQVKAGHMTREQARTNRYRNVITQAIGIHPRISPDIDVVRLEEGDSILFCSDGLSTELTDAEIAGFLAKEPDPQAASEALVQAALQNGGSDNVTVVVFRFGAFTPYPPSVEEDEIRTISVGSDIEESALEEGWEEAPPWSKPALPKSAGTGVPMWLPVLLAMVAAAEGAGLYWMWREHQRPKTNILPVAAPPKRTDLPLSYGKPKLMLRTAVQDNYLLVEPRGSLIVVDADRRLIRVTTDKKAPLPGLSLPATTSSQINPATSLRVRPIYMTVDASGNRYQTNPVTRTIDKFNPVGTRIMEDIGKGLLSAPASLGVDTLGNLYVIDNHHLKQLLAAPMAADAPAPVNPAAQLSP